MKKRYVNDKIDKFKNSKIALILLSMISFILFISKAFFILSLLLIVCLTLMIYNNLNMKLENEAEINEEEIITSRINSVKTTVFSRVPFPILFLMENGNVIWYNEELRKIVDNKTIARKNVKELIKEINVKLILDGRKSEYKKVNFNDRVYNIYTNVINDGTSDKYNNLVMMSFYDITENIELEKKISEKTLLIIY